MKKTKFIYSWSNIDGMTYTFKSVEDYLKKEDFSLFEGNPEENPIYEAGIIKETSAFGLLRKKDKMFNISQIIHTVFGFIFLDTIPCNSQTYVPCFYNNTKPPQILNNNIPI